MITVFVGDYTFTGLRGSSNGFMIMGPLFGFLGAVVFEVNWIYISFTIVLIFDSNSKISKLKQKNVQPAYAWSWTCGCTDSKQVLS